MPAPKYSARPDTNQPEIVAALTALGFLVLVVGGKLGVTPDILVWGYNARTQQHEWTAWEIKTATGKLSPAQKHFMNVLWPGAVKLTRSLDTILAYYGQGTQGA